MDLIGTLLCVSFATGLNLYATVLAMGILNRLGILHLPPNLAVIASMPVMVVATVLYGVEFLVDKVPFLDTFWDGLHTILRPARPALFFHIAWSETSILRGRYWRHDLEAAVR
jgi:hypothetical protein